MCAFSSLTGADGALLHERCVLSLLTAADTPAATSFTDSIKGGEGRAALDQRLLAHKKHSSLQEEAEASFKVVRLPVVRLPATRNKLGGRVARTGGVADRAAQAAAICQGAAAHRQAWWRRWPTYAPELGYKDPVGAPRPDARRDAHNQLAHSRRSMR